MEEFRIKFRGVRGSYPVANKDFLKYGFRDFQPTIEDYILHQSLPLVEVYILLHQSRQLMKGIYTDMSTAGFSRFRLLCLSRH